ncbi:hypothetical protein HF086_012756 [Spodoptera exigua]|uniref:Phosphatase and actin regulator 1 n=1 Tax=Spodoptera exigua TaxID=7107 RepID=A0A922MWE8_SPOEX|nr:hypothetical protein HF086_012756 [Spodoptera exigua]
MGPLIVWMYHECFIYKKNVVAAKKQNGSAVRTNSLGSGARTPPAERSKSKFSAFGRLFKPWKWKRKKKSEKFEAASRTLERKISVRANRDELVQKGILLPESPVTPVPEVDEPVSPPTGGEEARSDVSAAQANQDRLMGMHAALQAQLASQLQQQQAAMAAAVAAAAAAHHHHQNNNVIGQYLNAWLINQYSQQHSLVLRSPAIVDTDTIRLL